MTNSSDSEIILLNESGIPVPVNENDIRDITGAVEIHEEVSFHLVEVVYVTPDKIRSLNRGFLKKNYITDIITFPYSAVGQNNDIEVTLTCCAERIDEQSFEFDTSRKSEYYRVLIHGLLHVSGFDDSNKADADVMKNRENYYLRLFNLSQ